MRNTEATFELPHAKRLRTKGMCDKCIELDRNIEHYRDIASRITDQAMLRGIEVLIERAKARKAALHPEQ
jgi:hypothetical protein